MIITDLGDIRPTLVDGGGSVLVHLNHHQSVLCSTTLEAHQIADAFRKAANYLDERARLIRDRKDRDCAVLLNDLNEEMHREWGRTLPGFTPPPSRRVPLTGEAS